mgnify:CR=1 FL=1
MDQIDNIRERLRENRNYHAVGGRYSIEQRRALLQELKHFKLSITGPRPVAEAIVTSGGVKVGEVNPNSMESKKVRGLFFAGEILDVDAYTGGFNLQIAWSTGRAAGIAAAEIKGEGEL